MTEKSLWICANLGSVNYMHRYSLIALTALLFFASCGRPDRYRGGEGHIRMERQKWTSLENRPKIVIDAGHGGKDAGAQSKTGPKEEEKALTLTTALILESMLQRMGYQTILTRGDDNFVPLDLRAAFANGNRATLFVSVHYNSAPNSKAHGVEVYYYNDKENPTRAELSKHFGQSVLNCIVANTQCKSRGVKHGNLAVVRETKMPAILVEGGFVSNEGEMSKLRDLNYLTLLAQSIAQGIQQYMDGSWRGK